ncbi:hypothetical protein KUCAC02_010836 [Chaenocephalus aceratus]|uniref:Uncharacterized protein n=1 Tax=Chaenocephalus aceratus TaxID=36190 RepID=A0ACB9WUR8_CHAAC|nr:hypothetical protein KUCAC02_010836 [Chaenocephalus aceratus]
MANSQIPQDSMSDMGTSSGFRIQQSRVLARETERGWTAELYLDQSDLSTPHGHRLEKPRGRRYNFRLTSPAEGCQNGHPADRGAQTDPLLLETTSGQSKRGEGQDNTCNPPL